MVGAGLVGAVEHVYHGHTEVHAQGVDDKEPIKREQGQAITR